MEDINAGASGSSPRGLMVHNGKLYFVATTATYGAELYSYDGNSVVRLTDVASGSDNGVGDFHLAAYNGFIFFNGSTTGLDHQLYKYNPANSTVSLVYTINPSSYSFVKNFVNYGNKLYFTANDANGTELWVHDGTNTSMVYDLNPGIPSGAGTDYMCVVNGVLYFSGDNNTSGFEIYSLTDPAAGIKSIYLNGNVTVAPNPTSGDATLQFSMKETTDLSITVTDATGKLVWEQAATKFTQGNTNIILPIGPHAAGAYLYSVKGNAGKVMASGKIQKL